jgi:hypothetical protein
MLDPAPDPQHWKLHYKVFIHVNHFQLQLHIRQIFFYSFIQKRYLLLPRSMTITVTSLLRFLFLYSNPNLVAPAHEKENYSSTYLLEITEPGARVVGQPLLLAPA